MFTHQLHNYVYETLHDKPTYQLHKLHGTTHYVLAASAATAEEQNKSGDMTHPDGTKSVEPNSRIWRPQVQSEYIEPDSTPDKLEHLKLLYKDYGTAVMQEKTTPMDCDQDDIIKFVTKKHTMSYSII